MLFDEIEFSSFLTYSPHGDSETALLSKTVMSDLKNDKYITLNSNHILMSNYLAGGIKKHINELEFADYFGPNTILIPAPKSSLLKSDTLWVPKRLAHTLIKEGLGKDVKSCLERVKAVPRASMSLPKDRPKAIDHYNSMAVQKILDEPAEIILIDDIITRGATLLGGANKLADAFPNARIRAFAFMRTISNPHEFEKIVEPCKGKITLGEDGTTLRRP